MTHNGGEGWVRRNGEHTGEYTSLGPVAHYSVGVVGLLVTVGLLFFLYPIVVAVTEPLHVLSSTAIVTLGISTWVVLWGVIEFVVDNRVA